MELGEVATARAGAAVTDAVAMARRDLEAVVGWEAVVVATAQIEWVAAV